MGKMSRDKGKRGELEVAALMREHGFEAKRGQQHCGGSDSPDVVHNIPNLHVEVKFRERFSIYEALDRAGKEGRGKVPAIFHRQVRKPWLVTLDAYDFLRVMDEMRFARALSFSRKPSDVAKN